MITLAHLAYYIGIAIVVVTHILLFQSLPGIPDAAAMKMHAQVNLLAAALIAFAWFKSCI